MILVVDDEPTTRNALQEVLTALNYQVLTATNGVEAMETIAQDPGQVEMVLTDFKMPYMSGEELCRHIADQYPEIHVILMTGYPQEADADLQASVPGLQRIQKPMSIDTLLRAVRV